MSSLDNAVNAVMSEPLSPDIPFASIDIPNGVWMVPAPVVPWMWQTRQGGGSNG